MSGYRDIIRKGRSAEDSASQKAVNTESGKEVTTENQKTVNDDPVNITIKVPRNHRQYWTSRAKLEGVTMTEVITKALEERFGSP